jgi:hypothetical protein
MSLVMLTVALDWIILLYSAFFQAISYSFGWFGVKVFKMPQWIVYVIYNRGPLADGNRPCMLFNNASYSWIIPQLYSHDRRQLLSPCFCSSR